MEQEPPNPQILPQSEQPVTYGPVLSRSPGSPIQKNTHSYTKPLLAVLFIIFIFIVGAIFLISRKQPQTSLAPTPAPTIAPTPTPVRAIAPYATQSAFIAFEKEVTELPQIIRQANLDDQTITPPVLDLPLGFSN